ncbi:MAG: hypothetical protein ACLSAC_16065 [Enterocloster bolteae]
MKRSVVRRQLDNSSTQIPSDPADVKMYADASDGGGGVQVDMDDSYYYQILSDYVGLPIEGEIPDTRGP